MEVAETEIKLGYLTPNVHKCATADLTNIFLYYLLRSREYVKPIKVKHSEQMGRTTETVQFRVYDIGFWKDSIILSRYLQLDMIILADSAKMKISNQKNGRTG